MTSSACSETQKLPDFDSTHCSSTSILSMRCLEGVGSSRIYKGHFRASEVTLNLQKLNSEGFDVF